MRCEVWKSMGYELILSTFLLTMSRRGNCHDNAVAESFFATFKWNQPVSSKAWEVHPGNLTPMCINHFFCLLNIKLATTGK